MKLQKTMKKFPIKCEKFLNFKSYSIGKLIFLFSEGLSIEHHALKEIVEKRLNKLEDKSIHKDV